MDQSGARPKSAAGDSGTQSDRPTPKPPPPPPQGAGVQDPLLGKELGGCRIDGLLGRGAMGAVYRARQLSLDREVAVKVIRPELLTDQRILKRFEVEARTVGRFNSPHVVMVHDVGFEHDVHFLVMEFVKGKNLREHTKLLAGGRLAVTDALPLLRQACKGLEEAQRLGVLHRDIKPDNLMLTDRGVLKIADFGIAKPTQDDFSMTMTSELIGTPLYMSPEQCQASPNLDFRSDMYSLGATFYYLLTGEPPIRASSVYELIQTKTKLEYLCLWKALPELDENHPLSRVIERMTALSRDDRYDSYEALVADLALVEQGRTLEIQRPKSKVQSEVVVPPKKSVRGLLLSAAVLAALAAGGGYAWLQWQAAPPVVPGANLPALRQRFAESGPSSGLRDEVRALVVDATATAERDALLADLVHGLDVQGRLAAVSKPASLDLPFDDLRRYFEQVEAAVVVAGGHGDELQGWLATVRTRARAEAELGAAARAKLVSAFALWQNDRLKAGGDRVQVVELGGRLDTIEAARKQLLELLPQLEASLATELAVQQLAEARAGLLGSGPAVAPDVSKALAEIRADFATQGPVAAIENRLRDLQPTQPREIEEQNELLNLLQRAGKALGLAQSVRATFPGDPKLPFDDIGAYFTAIDRELHDLRTPEQTLPPWAAAERDKLRDAATLQERALQRCRTTWTDWQQRRKDNATKPTELAALEVEFRQLKAGIQRGKELFPAAAAEFDAIVPPAEVAATEDGLGSATKRLQWLGGMQDVVRRLERIGALADWRASKGRWEQELGSQRTAAADFAAEAEVVAELARATAVVERWREADARVTTLAAALAAGDFPALDAAVRRGLAGSEGREEFQAFAQAAAPAREAFVAIDSKLDLDGALVLLEDAAKALKVHGGLAPGAGERIERWTRAVRDLQGAAAMMVPITAGRTKAGVEVGGFFLSRTETTQAQYEKFLGELQAVVTAAGAADAAAMQRALEPRLGNLVPPAEVLAKALSRKGKVRSAEKPVEDLSWYEAAAYAAWFHEALPRYEEWALAAFGDGHQHTYPWGDEWTMEESHRNIGTSLAAADAGGRSWRSTGRSTIHHLAGNVAEWLAAAPGDGKASLAGGHYNDNRVRKEAMARAAGEVAEVAMDRALPGYGCRTILRPREVLAPLFQGGTYPTGR